MTIRFELRTTKNTKGSEMVPLHISVSDGRAFRQRQVTNIMVNPEHWDVKDPDLVSALTGHVQGSRAFTRYRTIDIDMKKDLVRILEGKQ